MPEIFNLPKVTVLPGANLYFYQSGTSTPQNVYTDIGLTVAHSQPITADANGVVAPIYLSPTLPNYRFRMETAAGVLIYQIDDLPSNQNVQQAMRLESTNPNLFLYDTDGTSGSRKYSIRAAGAAFEVQASNEAESVFTTILRFESGVLYSNETEVATRSYGSFTGTVTGLTTVVTGVISYQRVGEMITLSIPFMTGTSNSTSLTITGLPLALQPDNIVGLQSFLATNNGSRVTDVMVVINGAEIFFANGGSTTGWTNSGTKAIGHTSASGARQQITYPIS